MGSPSGGIGGGSENGGARETAESRASSQQGMTGSERTQEQAFNDAVERERANQPGGPDGGDTTPGYSGPNPDPRGPALDGRPEDKQDNDKPATPDPGGLPESDTTPNYTGPNPDPRGPALGGGDDDDGRPALALAGTVAVGFAAADGPLPFGDLVGIGAGLGILGYAAYQALTGPQTPDISYSEGAQGNSPPFKGEPGSTVTVTNPDGTPKQTRSYGEDGFPEKDIDYNHDHGQGQPHVHDWGRPEGGGKPRNEDRKPGRPPEPGELP
ncbi:MAG: hypothetical protein R3F54_14635 [Alphaproteobacteria bacterium]